jgi:hypothetical protein
MALCTRGSIASSLMSISSVVGSYMNSSTNSLHGRTVIKTPEPSQKSLPGWQVQNNTPGRWAR